MAHSVLLAVDQPEASAGQIYNCGDELQFSLAQWVEIIADAMDWRLEIVSVPDPYASPSRDIMQFGGSSHHQFLDLYKIRHQLGYTDRVAALAAVRKTVNWFRENPAIDPEYVAQIRAHYEMEDKLAAICQGAWAQMATLPHPEAEFHHSYAHPRQRGLARDHRDR